ncbi:MAG TPA: MFS transporter [Burkholderiaceae bacterium]|nr:MFS transporter [Burkholderiaceae bacterium]
MGRLFPPDHLLRDVSYRRLWVSTLISSLGSQVTMLALPLTAAVLLHASPTQMGWLTTMETLPFVLFSLPAGVWLDRVRKLPVYVAGELLLACSVALVPLAWWLGGLSMGLLYVVAFILGSVHTTSGSASQIVLMQVVSRDRLVEAHAKSTLASSGAEVTGPALAGMLIKFVGAPVALLLDALMLLWSAAILRRIPLREVLAPGGRAKFGRDLKAGLLFVRSQRLLVALAIAVGLWQMSNYGATVVQILFASRVLGLSEQGIGLAFVGLGLGTVTGSLFGSRVSAVLGPGPALVLGFAMTGLGWLLPAFAPANTFGVASFALMLLMFGVGAVLVFVNFLALRQAVTPQPMLGRMTTTMRWLVLIPAGPGALAAGWIAEHLGLRWALGTAGSFSLLVAFVAWRLAVIRNVRELPSLMPEGDQPMHAGQ